MRRFLTLVCLLCVAIPAGISISGCTSNPAGNYCNGLGYGLKTSDVSSITLSPATTGISLYFGQTQQVTTPSAYTCKNLAATVSSYTYGTTNSQLVDISPSGSICAGTWNRNTGGGIADYSVCRAPSPLPATNGLPYSTAYITASADSVTSNQVEVFVHAPVTSVSLVGPTSCISQNTTATLDAEACYGSAQNELCAPSSLPSSSYTCKGGVASGVTSVPTCTAAIGTLSYTVGTSSIASISTNTSSNLATITAGQPGTTLITASVAGSGSSAGFFSTCPPESISLTLPGGKTSGNIIPSSPQTLVTTVTDTNGNPITGLALDYQSTDPINISVASTGTVTPSYPGVASIYAVCQPSTCNPSPSNEIGLYGTGLPISSNPVTITTPGTASEYVWYAAPGNSQYFASVDMFKGTSGTITKLPYVPNSMVMDRLGNSLYFGSSEELMIYSTSSNTLTTQNTNFPGVVLAVSPNNSTVLINDQINRVFKLYNVSTSALTASFDGLGSAAAWTPDAKTLYITDSAALGGSHADRLYVYNANTDVTTYDLSTTTGGSKSLAITIPSVGAYLSGSAGYDTVAHTWCPAGNVGDYSGDANSILFYPQGPDNAVIAQTDALAATTDGQHILGAAFTGSEVTLTDIGITIPTTELTTGIFTPIACPETTSSGVETLSALSTNPWINATPATPTLDPNKAPATSVNQVVASPESNLAFITYTNSNGTTSAQLPYYVPNSSASRSNQLAGTVGYIALTGSAVTAPVAGAFSPDDLYFFASTSGDNMIHYISVPTLTDTQQMSPGLPACSSSNIGCTNTTVTAGDPVPATAIAVKPRSTT